MSPTREILFDLLFNALLQISLFAIVAAALSRLMAKAKAKYQYFFYVFVLVLSLVAPVVNTLWHRHSAGVLVLLCYKLDTFVSITLALGSAMQYVEVDEPPPAEFLASA